MAKKKRPPPLKIPPRRRRRGWTREFRNQVIVASVFVVFIAVVVGIIGFAFFQDYWEENVRLPNSTALQVGETTFDLDYFTRRMELTAGQYGFQGQLDSTQAATIIDFVIGSVIGDLQEEELLRLRAGPDLGITASTAEIEQQLADALGVSLDNREQFDRAYQAELEASDVSDQELWEMTTASVLSQKVRTAFDNSAPATAEQVNLRQIQVTTADEAATVRERLEAGEDFGWMAWELSQDTATKEAGGERGWLVREELDQSYADEVFALEVGTVSEPIEATDGFFIFEVVEKDPAREVSETQRSAIGGTYFSFWLDEQNTLFPTIDFIRYDNDKFQWAVERVFVL